MDDRLLCFFLLDLLNDLLKHIIWLCPHHKVPVGKDERRHACEPILLRQVDIGGYFRVEYWICQHIIEVLAAKADLLRDLFQHGLIIDRAGLLPVRLHDGFMESLSFSLRLGILFSNQRGAAVDARWT